MPKMVNIPFNELEIGTTASFTKQLTEEDIVLFARTSGDVNPVHLNDEYAKTTQFKNRIAHGMWSAGIISAALATVMPGPGTVYLGQSLSFRRPVMINDELTVNLKVLEKMEKKNFATIECVVVNQDGKTVVQGEAQVMVPSEKVELEVPVLPEIKIG
jgi:3-hydroxybutyryl-CoA dehydratase